MNYGTPLGKLFFLESRDEIPNDMGNSCGKGREPDEKRVQEGQRRGNGQPYIDGEAEFQCSRK